MGRYSFGIIIMGHTWCILSIYNVNQVRVSYIRRPSSCFKKYAFFYFFPTNFPDAEKGVNIV